MSPSVALVRRSGSILRRAGWIINDKRVEGIWQREGLKVPHKQPKRGRLWLADGSCIRLRPEHRNHVWSYDFVEAAPTMDASIGCSPATMNPAQDFPGDQDWDRPSRSGGRRC